MAKYHLGQKGLKKLYEYPKMWDKPEKLIISPSYITNGYIIFARTAVKGSSNIFTEDDSFSAMKVQELLKNPVQEITDDSVHGALGLNGDLLGLHAYDRTSIIIDGKSCKVDLWKDNNGLMLFNYDVLDYFKIKLSRGYATSNNGCLFDSELGKGFSLAIMPLSVSNLGAFVSEYSGDIKTLAQCLD